MEAAGGERDEAQLLRELCGKIRLTGPITVAEYMREVQTGTLHSSAPHLAPSTLALLHSFILHQGRLRFNDFLPLLPVLIWGI